MCRKQVQAPRHLAAWSLLFALVVGSRAARAGESSRLAYVRGEGADQCPDERALRSAVAVRLGYDPFVSWAKTTVHAQIAREGASLRARVYLADEAGHARGSRELRAPAGECDKLVAAAALAISIAIDPMSVNSAPHADGPAIRDAQAASPDTPVENTGAEPPKTAVVGATPAKGTPPNNEGQPRDEIATPSASTQPNASSANWFIGAGPHVASGTAPNLAAGLSGFVRFDLTHASLGLGARYDFPASTKAEIGTGVVTAKLLLVSLEPCFRWSPWSFCGLASVGSLEASGSGVIEAMERSTLYWAAGGRAAFEQTVFDRFALRAHVDLAANATRTTLRISGLEVWRAPALSAAAGLDAVARIW